MPLGTCAVRLERFAATLNRAVEWLCAALLAAMVLVVWAGAATRYLPGAGLSWTEELARYLMIWAALLAVSCAAWRSEHVGLDLLPQFLPAGPRRALRFAIGLCAVGFFAMLAWYGVAMTLDGRTQFSTLWGMTMELPFAAVPVSSALAAFQFLARMLCDSAGAPSAPAPSAY